MRWLVLGLGLAVGISCFPADNDDLALDCDAASFVDEAEEALRKQSELAAFDAWAYATNLTEETQKQSDKSETNLQLMNKEFGKEALSFDLSKIGNPDVKRKLKLLRDVGTAVLPEINLKDFIALKSGMGQTYSTAKVLDYKTGKRNFSLEPEMTEIFRTSRDPDELQYYWEMWREASGEQIRTPYFSLVELLNKAAEINGFKDASIMKVVGYESESFHKEMETTWLGLKPLYEQLHAYVRSKLNKYYGEKVVARSGPLPAHLLGNMWAQSWGNLADILQPYPDKPSIDVTEEMVRQGWTPKKMFQEADNFFHAIGLERVPEKFWSESLLEKPEDGREVVCHASAWDFYNGQDFRIKQCTRVEQTDFVTVNHEMGHVQYFLQYRNQSYLYRDGANSGFHEGVGDLLSLAVGTASYFKTLGLLGKDVNITDTETDINILFNMALERIAFLPFGYFVDKFRWDVYSGKTSVENMNCHWWKLRNQIQGMKPPSKRSFSQFDPGAKFHVANDVGYVRYFTAYIYQFQFYSSLCKVSGSYVPGDPDKPLHRCNFYGSLEAGDKLREILRMGAGRPWKDAMEKITGQREMNTDAIREYFEPLEDWLEKENKDSGVEVGWGDVEVDDVCQQFQSEQNN